LGFRNEVPNIDYISAPLRILLVEDTEYDRLVFRRAFQQSEVSCEITECVRAEEALDRLRADASSFDLAVIDHGLPGMSGWDLCQELLNEEIPLPLVLLNGGGSEQLAVEALKAGVYDYIVKEPGQGYLDLLPVLLPEVVRRHDDRLARQRSEVALRESEAKYAALVEQAKDGIAIVQDGLFRFVNRAMAENLGYTVEEMLGTPSLNIFAPEIRDLVAEGHRLRMAGEEAPSVYEARLQCKDGTVKDVEISAGIIQYDGKPALVGMARDITERKRAEEALCLERDNLRSILEAMEDGVFIANKEQDITYINDALQKELGSYRDKKCYEYFNDRDEVCPRCPVDGVFAGKTIRLEWHYSRTRKNYDIIHTPLRNPGGSISSLAIFRDITERKRAEQEILQHHLELSALHEALLSISQSLDLEAVLSEIVSQAGKALGSEYTSITLLNEDGSLGTVSEECHSVPPFSVRARPGGVTRRIVSTGEPVIIHDVDADGNTNPAIVGAGIKSYAGVAVKTKGVPIGVLFVHSRQPNAFSDKLNLLVAFANQTAIAIENARLYEQESRARHELEVEAKRRVEFLRALVHELKTPVTSVMASSEFLTMELPEGPLLSMARNLSRGANNLNNRIDELLDLARGELGMLNLRREEVDPLQLLEQVLADMAPLALSRSQSLLLDTPSSLPIIWADKGRLSQVVTNLVGNASKFMSQEGKITLRAREQDSALVMEVQDTGPGIDKDLEPRLFHPYDRLVDDREHLSGLGLGLALCKTLVELHGGQIWVESEKGEGSTFSFTVPLAISAEKMSTQTLKGKRV